MAGTEEIVMLPLSGDQGHIQGYITEGDITAAATTVNYGQLNPIIMTMANMANVSEEVQVSTQEAVAMDGETDMSDSNLNDILRSHLVSNTPKMVRTTPQHPYTSTVYTDSETGVTYEVVKGGTKRGGDRLIDSLGFTYNLKQGRSNKNTLHWWCAVRNSKLRCPAMVMQQGKTFQRGKRKHEHLVGQNTPKPHIHNYQKPVMPETATPTRSMSSEPVGKKMTVFGNQNYRIIKEGSKAGMDLLKDKFGYTFTLKKQSADRSKCTWRCSIRNSYHTCRATVTQTGNQFKEGPYEHSHLPNSNKPLGEDELVPRHTMDEGSYLDDEDDDGGGESELDASQEHGYDARSHSTFSSPYNKSPKKINRFRAYNRERKRKDHPTFLGPSCTINLTKCDAHGCNCKMVHCPFCDPSHFYPAKAGRVQDHLELAHFAHGVQYDDLMIVKCFQDCNVERNYGHYHCVFCCQQILKRNAYARHMLRHMRKMGIPDRLLVLPDSKYPDVINAYGFEIPICKKVACSSGQPGGLHYHCPQCKVMCRERSLTVNHLWRCLQRKTGAEQAGSDEEEMPHGLDETQLNLHFSHYKSFNDLPLVKCQLPACCGGMYHCRLCPVRIFVPTYRQHLIAHYVAHWKQRILYKGYSLLKCFQTCEGLDRSLCKVRYHFHCPICCKMILTKGSFEEHLKGCHLFKFGENLIVESAGDADKSLEADLGLAMDMSTINDNVDYMEDRLTEKAAEEHRGRPPRRTRWKGANFGGRFRGPSNRSLKNVDKLVKVMRAELADGQDYDAGLDENSDEDQNIEDDSTNLSDDILGLNIKGDEIFELGTVIFSEKLIEALKSAAAVSTVLGKVSNLTGTRLTEEDGRYILSGKLEDLIAARQLMIKTIQGSESDVEEEEPPVKRTKSSKDTPASRRSKTTPKSQPAKKAAKGSAKKAPEAVPAATPQRGRGRPKKTDDSFPYSEIKEIIAASKQTDDGKRGRGRPPKKLPVPTPKELKSKNSTTASEKKSQQETPKSGPYSTRGIKRNYQDMNAGRVEIKQELLSGEEDEDDEQDDGSSEAEEEPVTPKRGRGRPPKNPRAKDNAVELEAAEEVADDEDDVLDDMEQESQELGEEEGDFPEEGGQQEGGEADPSQQALDGTVTQTEQATGSRGKITDSVVRSLRTTNVSTSVPAIAKLGIRRVRVGKRQTLQEQEEALDKKMDRVADQARADSLACSLCDDFTAPTFADLTAHLKGFHHVNEPPRCDICEMDFDTIQTLTTHLYNKHGPKPEPKWLTCGHPNCHKRFTSRAAFTGHVNKVHFGKMQTVKRYTCTGCDFKTNSREDLWEHKKIAHEEKLECKPCSIQFASFSSMKAHNDAKHSADGGDLLCHVCSEQFPSKVSLQKHIRQQHEGGTFKCNVCGKQLSTKSSYHDHMERHKPELDRQYRYYCAYCGKGFSVKSNFEDHQNKHTGRRPYKCDLCQQAFGFRSMLKKHKIFVHSNERPYKCGFCMKGFKFMNLLKNHITTHTNKSDHTCSYCSKTMSTASSLKFHMKKCGSVWKDAGRQASLASNSTSLTGLPLQQVVMDQPAHTSVLEESVDALGSLVSLETESAVLEAPIQQLEETGITEQASMEVYACSECNATFTAFHDAEQHILAAHSAVPTQ